ncbi:hypothetical protein AMTR_s00073p00060520 [Amborella trichopoda]|uniref:Uncharacterized protein n=1 Tax=Amborella trichopoda TaxID=13333 RepID=W1NNJ6_AMBTC|nr:hypothetical protein AMTR_s00073p00060520 [Amborella trichopoda]
MADGLRRLLREVEREAENCGDGEEVWCNRKKGGSNRGCCLVEGEGNGEESRGKKVAERWRTRLQKERSWQERLPPDCMVRGGGDCCNTSCDCRWWWGSYQKERKQVAKRGNEEEEGEGNKGGPTTEEEEAKMGRLVGATRCLRLITDEGSGARQANRGSSKVGCSRGKGRASEVRK